MVRRSQKPEASGQKPAASGQRAALGRSANTVLALFCLLTAGGWRLADGSSQKKVEKPKVHADFHFGSLPLNRDAGDYLSTDERARMLVVAFHEGWSTDKFAKEFKISPTDLVKTTDKLEDTYIAGHQNEYDMRPFLPVIRDLDIAATESLRLKHSEEFLGLLEAHWKEFEDLVSGLDGAKSVPREQALYQAVVSGLLFGGNLDAFFEDKTILPPPPRRNKAGTSRFYAWLVESDSAFAGQIVREFQTAGNHRIVSVGTSLPEDRRLQVEDLRGTVPFYEGQDARKWRVFMSIFSRDTVMPFFKTKRDELRKVGNFVRAGNYVAFAEVFAWHYQMMADYAAQQLVAKKRIAAPEKYYTYVIDAPPQ